MAKKLEGAAADILKSPNYAVMSIPRKDGSVQSVVVWAHLDDNGEMFVNGAEGRLWPENLRRAKTATLTAFSEGGPYEYVAVTGALTDEVPAPQADADINFLAKKYIDADEYPFRSPGEERVTFRLQPERINYVKQG